MKNQLVSLSYDLIAQTCILNSTKDEQREDIKNYIGLFGNKADQLIETFYNINCQVGNGGAPILKQLILLLSNEYSQEIVKECIDFTFEQSY